ncbi:uncharacterized protein LOC103747946 [Nannospalax galili]|uniref:uncharacterized protein LOC103747946 n=1 Tax=Nannospalax galili TaxID=1026970 RepID=UPI0004ED1E41|nr:uncharacterized protein LOC103747946 [Nannospalax galili]
MKALIWRYHVLCLVWYCCAMPQMQKQIMSSSSLIIGLPSMENFIDIPWLVSMPGYCQGIVLTPWLILSTANCLKKSKLSQLDISGVNDPESIPHGQKVCLHPKFDPKDGNDPVRGDIGLVILEEPLYGDDIPLSQAQNISLKSCSRCQYRSCDVYEYQSSKKLGTTRVKKISVELLDFATCHHQRSYLEKTEGLCIQSQPQEDCWIQRSSPVLCLLKNHWELVGLVHKTSRICHNPTVIIRTAPYVNWMKRFIKVSKKLLNPTSSLECRTLRDNEYVPQIKHGHSYLPTLATPNPSIQFLQEGSNISPLIKHIKKFPAVLNFSHLPPFTADHKIFLDKSHTPQAGKFLVEQMKVSPISGLPETPEQNPVPYHQDMETKTNNLTPKSSLAQVLSDTAMSYTPPKANSAKPWHFAVGNRDESLGNIMPDLIKQWRSHVDNVVDQQEISQEP